MTELGEKVFCTDLPLSIMDRSILKEFTRMMKEMDKESVFLWLTKDITQAILKLTQPMALARCIRQLMIN